MLVCICVHVVRVLFRLGEQRFGVLAIFRLEVAKSCRPCCMTTTQDKIDGCEEEADNRDDVSGRPEAKRVHSQCAVGRSEDLPEAEERVEDAR